MVDHFIIHLIFHHLLVNLCLTCHLIYHSIILLILSHLLSSIVRFTFIFRVDRLLSLKQHMPIKRRLQRCWWKLELIHSWGVTMLDQFPILSFPFHICRVKQQEIMQEKGVILILKDCWRIMREILKDWKVWEEFDDKIS